MRLTHNLSPITRNLVAEKHAFSSKERDVETGLSYFGARYYSSELSIWLSVDPMSDKYPSLSPYVYCADNPVKLVDPNGEEWLVNQEGYVKEGENKSDKTLYAVQGIGNEFGYKLTYRNGWNKGQNISMSLSDIDLSAFTTDENGYSQIDLTGNEKTGMKMIRFLSQNTNVEWSFWSGNIWNNETNTEVAFATLGTSHIKSKDPGSTSLVLNASIKKNENHNNPLTFFYHTHPCKAIWGTWASSNDRDIRTMCLIGSPNASIGIIHKGILWDYFNNKIKADF